MKNIKTIEYLAYLIKKAQKENKPKPIFFLGAGASKSGNIPLADEIAKDILEKHSDNPDIQKLKKNEQNYIDIMTQFQPAERKDILKEYIKNSKLNVTHIYLAHLLNKGFVDYVLTVNFDNLMLRALALYNKFPATYDMAILKDFTTTTFEEQSVVYLHGKHDGLWQLNTDDEMKKVNSLALRIFDTIKNNRPWIIIGYSGSDAVFNHIKNLGRFDNGLFWVGYKNEEPNKNVKEFLNFENKNCYYIKGYDSDSFMLKLNELLGLGQPKILDKPFSCLKDMLEGVNDIDEEENFEGVKERLEINKKNVNTAIKQFEENKITDIEPQELTADKLRKEIINLIISGKYDSQRIKAIEEKAITLKNYSVNKSLSDLYFNWGVALLYLAKAKGKEEAEKLYLQAIEKYEKAIKIKHDNHEAFNNWGVALQDLAKTKEKEEAEKLYLQAIEKYEKTIEIKSNDHKAFNNWGVALQDLAKTKGKEEAEKLCLQAFEKYKKAIEIKPDEHEAFNNWGNALLYLAKTKEKEEAEKLYLQAIKKYEKAVDIKPDKHESFNNWGTALSDLAKTKEGKEAEDLYNQAFEKCQRCVEIGGDTYNLSCLYANFKKDKENALKYLEKSLSNNEIDANFVLKDEDWKLYLDDFDFKALMSKYKK